MLQMGREDEGQKTKDKGKGLWTKDFRPTNHMVNEALIDYLFRRETSTSELYETHSTVTTVPVKENLQMTLLSINRVLPQ